MFCRNCGNQLNDNAKFCGLCGTPVVNKQEPQQSAPEPAAQPVSEQTPVQPEQYQQPFTQPQPIPEPEPAPIPQPIPAPQPEQPFVQNYQQPMSQPFPQQPYQQPAAQPYPQQAAAPVQQTRSASGKVLGIVMILLAAFFACTLFIKCYSIAKRDFSTYSYLEQLGKVADRLDKNVFTYTFDVVKTSTWYGAFFIISLWVNVLFAGLAVIMLIFALVRVFSSGVKAELRMWSDIRAALIFCFIGSFAVLASVITADVADNFKADLGMFEDWGCVPGVLAYVFVAAEIAAFVFCGIVKNKARNRNAVAPGYVNPQVPPYSNM